MDHYNRGRSLTHEVGHYLNLLHVWGDDGYWCSSDDFISDTPLQTGETYGCPSYPRTDSCTSSFPGIMFMNYMDYSYDESLYMFTKGQIARMRAVLVNSRSSLLQSDALLCSQADSSDLMKLPTNVYNAVDSLVPVENIL